MSDVLGGEVDDLPRRAAKFMEPLRGTPDLASVVLFYTRLVEDVAAFRVCENAAVPGVGTTVSDASEGNELGLSESRWGRGDAPRVVGSGVR